jgi:hypothetical protein
MTARSTPGLGPSPAGWLATSLAALVLVACSSPKSGGFASSDDASDDDASGNTSGSSSSATTSGSSGGSGSSGSSGGRSSGSSGTSGAGSSGSSGTAADGGLSPNERVNSGIPFSDAGVPYCSTSAPCDLKTNTCCVSTLGEGTCQSGHNANCGIGAAFQCIEKSECPSGQLCCGFQTDSSHGGSKCETVSVCPPQTSAQLCQTNGECAAGVQCIPQSCNVGAPLPANLTLCGLQSNSTYQCTAR